MNIYYVKTAESILNYPIQFAKLQEISNFPHNTIHPKTWLVD